MHFGRIQFMSRTNWTIAAIAAIVVLVLGGSHVYRIYKVNPLYSSCKARVKVGMTADEVKSICGKPLINVGSNQFSSFGYQERLVSEEHLKIDFENGIVVRVRVSQD